MASQADPNPAIPQPPAGIDGPNTEVGGAAMEADDLEDDEGFAQSTTTSYVTSLASNIRRGIEENGRIYPDYGQHLPSLPMDDQEQDRNDMQHCKFTLIYSGRLFLSPISYSPQNVLDLGTGTGIWAIDMADKYPSASVVGVDIAPIQSPFVPPNCQFEVEDVEADWTWPKSHYDFVHVRELLFAIRDYPRLIAQSFHALKPGGYLELASSVPNVSCDDNSLPPDTAYGELSQVCFDIGDAVGADMRAPTKWRRQLEDAGFVDVHETVFKVPTNPWPKDRRMKEIGAFELVQFRDAIEGIFTRGYIEVLKGDPVYLQLKLAQARVEIANRKMHSYILFYNVYGKKPYPSTQLA